MAKTCCQTFFLIARAVNCLDIFLILVLEYFVSLVGILFGSIGFLRFKVLIMSSTSAGDVGVKKKVFSDRFVR